MAVLIENPVLNHYRVPASNVFLMTRFANTAQHNAISNTVAQAVRAFGLEFIRADDLDLPGEDLWQKVVSCMQACEYGIAVYETIDKREFNPNVSLELGYMLALGRQCLLLKEKRLPTLPADLSGRLYREFDLKKIQASVLGQVANWLQQVGVRRRKNERVIVFVSGGGTCRCAMSKAITTHLLRKYKNHFRVESRAAFSPSRHGATDAAINAVKQTLGEDLLSDHRPRRIGVGFLYEADLILATDRTVLREIRRVFETYPGNSTDKALVKKEIERKSFLLTEYFGAKGNIADPWPDEGDAASKARYRTCMKTLYRLIAPNARKLLESRKAAPPIAFGTATLSGETSLTNASLREKKVTAG
jgi:protein-tyrosine-phosphatase